MTRLPSVTLGSHARQVAPLLWQCCQSWAQQQPVGGCAGMTLPGRQQGAGVWVVPGSGLYCNTTACSPPAAWGPRPCPPSGPAPLCGASWRQHASHPRSLGTGNRCNEGLTGFNMQVWPSTGQQHHQQHTCLLHLSGRPSSRCTMGLHHQSCPSAALAAGPVRLRTRHFWTPDIAAGSSSGACASG